MVHSEKAQDASQVLASATSSASYNVVLQVLFRLSTFALNALVLRNVEKVILGLANVRYCVLRSALPQRPIRMFVTFRMHLCLLS